MRRAALLALATALWAAPPAAADPIPQGSTSAPPYTGHPAVPHAVPAPIPPPHPHMAPNERSNLHDDAYQTDTYRRSGPLGDRPSVASQFFGSECASVTFDARGRLVTVCVGVSDVTLRLLDPVTLAPLASYALPRRQPGAGTFTNFTGGGYFYLDDRDRAVIPTTERHVVVVRETEPAGFALDRDYDLTAAVPGGDAIISALPDYSGRLWFASRDGVVGTADPATGAVRSLATGEPIGNSFAVDADGSVSIVTDAALYRFEAAADGTPRPVWRRPYDNVGTVKPGQTQAGSGTTPTLMGDDLVAITDNADPMNVVVYRRGAAAGGAEVCRQPVFSPGASDTDQSLIATGTSIVAENNFGYSGPGATEQGRTTQPGIARVDVDRATATCRLAWTSDERAPSVVPKLALGSGLVYTYTKPPRAEGDDPWYFTALDFATGETVYRVLAGEGLGFNNNYAPVTIGPDGTAYVGVLGGILAVRDATPPDVAAAPEPSAAAAPRRGRGHRLTIRVRCRRHGRLQIRVRGAGIARVRAKPRGRRARADRRRPYRIVLGRGARRVRLTVRWRDGHRRTLHLRSRRCRR